ncbi:L-lactate dehydrogenase [Microbacterium oryzae]|uniref:L-lactate dehydrogenase n=1 Tax=Microbacterium oryzae TaxID=743009 RepID=A0A6I6DU95_9MICO|nr:L-lactate dehydrogenase [Microbacterium oryzae]QGU27716.1 L-lactate dehydrogenase [Microbacterium oryzae]
MSAIENAKVAVIGAGAVGASTAYALLIRGAARQVALYDVNTAKVDAEVLDLAHGALFTGASTIAGGSDISVVAGAQVVVITAGAAQRPGQTRLDLIGTNARILETLLPQLLEVAPDAVYIVVSNPCDVLTSLAVAQTGLPPQRLFASGTVLDTSRLRWRLSQRTGVTPSSVHAHIVGEHGDSEFPLWSSARIGPVPILDWQPEDGGRLTLDELEDIASDVRNAAYTVIQGKGATNYAIGLSATRIVEAVLRDEHAILPVSTVLSDFHGMDGVALSVPSVVSASGATAIRETSFDERELASLRASAAALADIEEQLRG